MSEGSLKTIDDNQLHSYRLLVLHENGDCDTLNKRSFEQLDEFNYEVEIFNDKNLYLDYIDKQNSEPSKCSIVLIVSDKYSDEVLPKLNNNQCILFIFILCLNSNNFTCSKFPKLQAICYSMDELIRRIQSSIYRYMSSLEFSLFHGQDISDEKNENHCIRKLIEDEPRFLWFFKCHKFMVKLEHDDQAAKQQMVACLRENTKCDRRAQNIISEFEDESLEENKKNIIKWYTNNSVICRSMNKILAIGRIQEIYSYRFFIKLLCQKLKELYRKSLRDGSPSNAEKTLYRGQKLLTSQILAISKCVNCLISFNTFLSTTEEIDVAKRFSFSNKTKDEESVLFHIEIKMNEEHSIPFADIREISHYPEEEEILFSIGTIYRIISVDYDAESSLYNVYLSLNQHEQLNINKYIDQTFSTAANTNDLTILFGKLLFEMGEYEFAIQYYQNQIDNLSSHNNHHRATYLSNIGTCYQAIGRFDEALKRYNTASKIYIHFNNREGLAACKHNMASAYYRQGDFDNATKYALQSLEGHERSQIDRASTLDLLGCIELDNHDLDTASSNLCDALKIRLNYYKKINSNHPDIGASYFNLGRLDLKRSALNDAQENFLLAERIFRHNYPQSHSTVQKVQKYLQEISKYL